MPHEPSGLPPIVLVDDEPDILMTSRVLLRTHGFGPVETLQRGRELIPFLEKHGAGVVVLDILMPELPGYQLLKMVNERFPGIPAIMMTAVDNVDIAVQCMRDGAFDYLVKPVEETRFLSSVQRALERSALERENRELKGALLLDGLRQPQVFERILTRNGEMKAIFKYIEAVARSTTPILVTGETGVGKELLVEAIHKASGRVGRLVAVNVAGIDDNMFSDTLFGHRKGAFSGADQARGGMIAQAEGGTLFLDEIGDLEPTSQVKLLRLLQERTFFPLGSDVAQTTDARVVCATHRDLEERMRSGAFRADLFFRLSSHQIRIPPLRDRKEDIAPLVRLFLDEAAATLDKPSPTPPPELFQWLKSYPFPGNVRELQAMIMDAVARHTSGVLSVGSFKQVIRKRRDEAGEGGMVTVATDEANLFQSLPDPLPTLDLATQLLIQESLRRADGNQRVASALLGISRHTLMRRLRQGDGTKKGR